MIGFASSATRCLLVFAALAPLVGFAAVGSAPAIAHEVRPAYLEFKEEAPDVFDVVFKTPMQGDLRLALTVSVSGESEPFSPAISGLRPAHAPATSASVSPRCNTELIASRT